MMNFQSGDEIFSLILVLFSDGTCNLACSVACFRLQVKSDLKLIPFVISDSFLKGSRNNWQGFLQQSFWKVQNGMC